MSRKPALLSLVQRGREADTQRRTFETLDVLRGVAASAVVCFHFGAFYDRGWLSHGYLAVDLFFALSGFILAYRYQSSLDADAAVLPFLKARLIRLYPLYLLGLGLGFAFLFAHHARTHDGPGRRIMLATLLLNLVFLPAFIPDIPQKLGPWRASFPYNHPAWSLFSELIANILHAVLLRRRSTGILLLLAGCFGAGLGVVIFLHGTVDVGVTDQTTFSGLLRVGFSYTVGMLVCRLWHTLPELLRVSPLLPMTLLLGLLLFPNGVLPAWVADAVGVLLLTPAILLLAVYSDLPPRCRGLSTLIGTMSYAVYAVHIPLLLISNASWSALGLGPLTSRLPVAFSIYLAVLLATSFLLDRFYDIPVRAWLRATRFVPDRTLLASLLRSRYPEPHV